MDHSDRPQGKRAGHETREPWECRGKKERLARYPEASTGSQECKISTGSIRLVNHIVHMLVSSNSTPSYLVVDLVAICVAKNEIIFIQFGCPRNKLLHFR